MCPINMPKATYFSIGFIIFVIGISIGFFGKDFYDKGKKIVEENNQPMSVSTMSTSSCLSIDWTNLPFDGENYFQQYALRGKIAAIHEADIILNIGNIDDPGQPLLSPDEKTNKKIITSSQTEIVEQPENKMGEPAPINGAKVPLPESDKNELKTIAITDLKIGDIVFIIALENVQTANELTAIKIVKEQSDLMEAAPLPES